MSVNVTEIFGSNVFSTNVMRERLPKKVFQEVMHVMEHGGNISMATADIVANAMKDWAVEKVPPTIPTGFNLSPVSLLKNMMPLSHALKTTRFCCNSQENSSSWVNRMPPHSHLAVCVPPTMPVAIQPGT